MLRCLLWCCLKLRLCQFGFVDSSSQMVGIKEEILLATGETDIKLVSSGFHYWMSDSLFGASSKVQWS